MNPKKNKFDHVLYGLIPGLVLPVLVMHFILSYYSNFTLEFIINNSMFSPLVNDLKGALLVNLGIFFIFYWLKKDNSSKGVVFATLIYGALYLYYMFFM